MTTPWGHVRTGLASTTEAVREELLPARRRTGERRSEKVGGCLEAVRGRAIHRIDRGVDRQQPRRGAPAADASAVKPVR
jgi:hypothetical protein